MTTREKAHRLLDELSDEDLVVEYRRLRAAVEGGGKISEREEEAAGFSWEKYR